MPFTTDQFFRGAHAAQIGVGPQLITRKKLTSHRQSGRPPDTVSEKERSAFKNIADVQKLYNIRYEEGTFISSVDAQPYDIFIEKFKFSKEDIDIFHLKPPAAN